jgi:hypothetical protein
MKHVLQIDHARYNRARATAVSAAAQNVSARPTS